MQTIKTIALALASLCAVNAFLGHQPRLTVQRRSISPRCMSRASISMSVDLPKVPFSKYHGIGNDFILVDNRQSEEPMLTSEQSKVICSRRYSVGADGVIFALPGKDGTDYTMRIYNSDGSEPEMCGNGIRCLAKFLRQLEGDSSKEDHAYRISTLAGVIVPVVRGDGLVTVDMGEPILEGEKVPTTLPAGEAGRVINVPVEVGGKAWEVTAVSMGNPHLVIFVPMVDAVDLARFGPIFENHPAFPNKINTEFVQVISPKLLRMKVWERGAGPTLACGTGACALTVAAILAGKTKEREVTVQLPGGDLQIEWRASDNHIYMTGPADLVYSGVLGT